MSSSAPWPLLQVPERGRGMIVAMVEVTVAAKQIGNRRVLAPAMPLELEGGPCTLSELLARVVADEVAVYEERRSDRALLRVLTEDEVRRGVALGGVDLGGRDLPAAPPVAVAIERAVEAFTDGLYFVFIDDQQIESLDDMVHLREGSQILFVRLVALAGG